MCRAAWRKSAARFSSRRAITTTFAAVAPVRKALGAEGQRTIFNLLGPLLNPARPDARLVGVFKLEHVALYQHTLEKMHCPRFTVAYGVDAESGKAIGEVSAQGETQFGSTARNANGSPLTNLSSTTSPHINEMLESLLIRTPDESASRIESIHSGEDQGLARETLLINAAIAGWTHGVAASLVEGLAQAGETLDSGRALAKLRKWQEFSDGL